jgi:hypothetical protein
LVIGHGAFIVFKVLTFSLKRCATDPQAHEESNESNASKKTESKSLAFGLDLGCGGEDTAGDEWTYGSSCCGKSLREAVELSEGGVGRCGIRNL